MLFVQFIFKKCKTMIYKYFEKHLSLMKTLKYLAKFPEVLFGLFCDIINDQQQEFGVNIIKLKRYCCYESRRKRLNFEQERILILA